MHRRLTENYIRLTTWLKKLNDTDDIGEYNPYKNFHSECASNFLQLKIHEFCLENELLISYDFCGHTESVVTLKCGQNELNLLWSSW